MITLHFQIPIIYENTIVPTTEEKENSGYAKH